MLSTLRQDNSYPSLSGERDLLVTVSLTSTGFKGVSSPAETVNVQAVPTISDFAVRILPSWISVNTGFSYA